MNFLKRSLVSLLCAGALLIARPALSIPTTTTGGTVVLGGIVVLVLYVAKIGPFEEKKDTGSGHVQVTPDEAAKLANVYLHELGPSLTQAVTSGNGPVVNDWARTLKLPAEHAPHFGELLHANRVELLQLDALTDARAARFFERLSELVNEDPLLQKDVQLLRAQL